MSYWIFPFLTSTKCIGGLRWWSLLAVRVGSMRGGKRWQSALAVSAQLLDAFAFEPGIS